MTDKPDKDTPLRLADAIEFAFPFGGMTVSGLRREASRGRLSIERIAGKDFVTLAAIEEMRKLCVVTPGVDVSVIGQPSLRGGSDGVSTQAFLAKLERRKAERRKIRS